MYATMADPTTATTRLTKINQNRSGTTGVISAGSNLAACLNETTGDFLASIEDVKSGSTFYLTVWPLVVGCRIMLSNELHCKGQSAR